MFQRSVTLTLTQTHCVYFIHLGLFLQPLTKCDPLENRMANHFSILALRTPWTVWKGKKDTTLKDEPSRSVGVLYAVGEEWRNSSRGMKRLSQRGNDIQLWCVWWCKEQQYCIGTWSVRSRNQGKLELVKQKVARVNTEILVIGELKWTGMANLIQITIISTTVGKNPLEEMK